MTDGIRAEFENQEVFLTITNLKIQVKKEEISDGINEIITREIPLNDIRSLHVKNNEGFFLRLQLLEESIIFGFDTHHIRDITKSILLSFIKTDQEVMTRILESDLTTKALFDNLKQHIPSSKFWSINKDRMRRMLPVVRQQPSKEIDMDDKDFILMLNPTLLRIFGEMNCSLNQFYNLLNQSYFNNTKNQKNSLDRMISSTVRGCDVEQDFATRINSYSVLALKPIENVEMKISDREGKRVEFLPVYPFEENKTIRPRRVFEFKRNELSCDTRLEVEPMMNKVSFEKKDLVWIRDLSRMVYKAMKEADTEFLNESIKMTSTFLDNMRKKYGDAHIRYLSRILPTHFIKDVS